MKLINKIKNWFAEEINNAWAIYLTCQTEEWHKKRHEKLKRKGKL